MMMKKVYILLALILIGFGACNTGDDLYTDPSNPAEVSPATMLTSVEVNTFMNIEGELDRIANIYSQHFAGSSGQFIDVQNYDLSESEFDNMWAGLYSGTMYNAKLLIDNYGEKNPYYSGISKILFALNLGVATDLWGDVPYSEAFQAVSGNFTAKYDSQEDVLKSIQTLLDDAITELNKSSDDNAILVGEDDVIFQGDVNSWVRAAWIIKARYANRLSLKDSEGSANLVKTYISNALAVTDAVSNMEAPHSSSSQNQWGAFENQRSGYIVANKTFVDYLSGRNDPRLAYYFSKTSSDAYVGGDIQSATVSTSASPANTTSSGFFNVARNFPIVTNYELYFLLAEAQSRLGEDATDALNSAIKESVSYVTSGNNDGSTLANYSNPSITNILTEKWIAFCGQMEAYNDYRRTGIPALTPRAESLGAVRAYTPLRMTTPQNERVGNPTNALVYELNAPVWWAKAN
jgi:Starch-binding associating with outer membrane